MIHALNQAILTLAPAHVAREFAPSTFAELMHARDAQALPVWQGASDATIFRDARVNHAFRAWHDATHARNAFGFTLAGEIATCEAQCAELLRVYGARSEPLAKIIRCEVIGQAEHFARVGAFPVDQEQFARTYLAARGITLRD